MAKISRLGKTLAATTLVAAPLLFGVLASHAAEDLPGGLIGAGPANHSVGGLDAPPGVGLGGELGSRLMR